MSYDDDKIEIYRGNELVRVIEGHPMRIYMEDPKTIVFETRKKTFRLSFTRPITIQLSK